MSGRLSLAAGAGVLALLVVAMSGQAVEAAHAVYRQGTGSIGLMQFFDLDKGKAGHENLIGPDLLYDMCEGGPCGGQVYLMPEYGMRKMSGGTPSYSACRKALRNAGTKEIRFKSLPRGTWLCVTARHRISGNTWGTRNARVKVTHSPTSSTDAFKFSYLVWA